MKKSIALLLTVILLISVICTALAVHNHQWHEVSAIGKGVIRTETIAYQHGCIRLSNPHTHKRTYYRQITRTYVCPCGQHKTVVSSGYLETCPKQ